MKNFEKYKTADERAEKFEQWCRRHVCCSECELDNQNGGNICAIHWLDLEAEEETPLPCPYCGGGDFYIHKDLSNLWTVECNTCLAQSKHYADRDNTIAAHNRVARAVMEAEKKGKRK